MHTISYEQYLASCCRIARAAGDVIMGYYSGEFTSRQKSDASPVTDADIAANQLIVNELKKLDSAIPIVAEEDETPPEMGHGRFWLVDPLDGTKSFVRREPEFTVNIGLIEHGRPVFGVIYAPPQAQLYYGHVGHGAFRDDAQGLARIGVRKPASDGLVIVKSRSHPSARTAAWLEARLIKDIVPISSSIKLCHIAEARADVYPRFGRTMEWDTAAGHAILEAAGGRVETVDGAPLTYGKAGYENPGFIAYGG